MDGSQESQSQLLELFLLLWNDPHDLDLLVSGVHLSIAEVLS